MAHKKPKGDPQSWEWEEQPYYWPFTMQVTPGAAASHGAEFGPGLFDHDFHIEKIMVSLENPPGGGKTVTVTVDNGVSTMTVAITGGADKDGSTVANAFDWDVSAQTLHILMTTTAGTTTGLCTIMVCLHEEDIP